MRAITVSLTLLGAGLAGCAGSGAIQNACLSSGRSAASPALCSCVQQVADQSLSRSEQRRAAAFFDDPQLAQDTRQAGGAETEFFRQYREFADRAERICG